MRPTGSSVVSSSAAPFRKGLWRGGPPTAPSRAKGFARRPALQDGDPEAPGHGRASAVGPRRWNPDRSETSHVEAQYGREMTAQHSRPRPCETPGTSHTAASDETEEKRGRPSRPRHLPPTIVSYGRRSPE